MLLRFANLGFREAAVTLAGIKMRVVGRDATLMRSRDGSNTSYETDTLMMGAGESYDVIFQPPLFSGGNAINNLFRRYDKYMLYNRRYTQEGNLQQVVGVGNAPKCAFTPPVRLGRNST